ncbi:bcl-2-related ovarian killer protein isoform X2 [Hydra vulgaris]|uniref:Bcl-2-related ovarian killer protein isoform X2 n=1 Tax=Hydra vulgaris TaxID=6087 RepID=A0ABM4BDI2_HYDVU
MISNGENNESKTLIKALSLWQTKSLKPTKKCPREESITMLFGKPISKVVPNSIEDITITSQKLCEDYIEARLGRSGIKEYNDSCQNAEELYDVVKNMGLILEMKYPKLFNKISVHLNLNYESEIVVWDSFNKFGTQLFSESITWAKIIAFFAFTGGLALDVMRHRKNDLIGRIIYWFSVFVNKKLSIWIQTQGGWKSIVDHFTAGNENNYQQDEREARFKWLLEYIEDRRWFQDHRYLILVVFLFIFTNLSILLYYKMCQHFF